ncbi:MAG: hypothetical protein GXP27_21095 [Planctomycetes bacterium]|nr:hypothetical protein [Planctomycetota bacterium]
MYRALWTKELREVLGAAAVAMAAYLLLVTSGYATGLAPWSERSRTIPFLGATFMSFFGLIAIALAITQGLKQTVAEGVRETYLFLLHRPIDWTRLIGVKLGVGLTTYLVCSAIPILLYAWWAATPGTHPSLFEWSMTARAWQVWGVGSLIYLGSFLSGLRPGRWFGTRLFPLAASAVGAGGCFALMDSLGLPGVVVLVLLDSFLVVMILFVATSRDYP